MAVNVLETKELLELSLLKCKLCGARLQSPVLQVGLFGNVCGSCCDRSVYTEVVRNVDLEALLQKLYFPCNYAERGCDFEGIFDDVCRHEKLCFFRKKQCPLVCENVFEHTDDVIEHVKSEHPDNVLTAVENYVSVQNPVESNEDVFYLLSVDNMNFMLRARLDVREGRILYAFYCLNYNLDIRGVKVSFAIKYDNIVFSPENVRVNRLHKSELPYEFIAKDATKLKLAMLEFFDCLNSITIKVDIEKNLESKQLSIKSVQIPSVWRQCTKCFKFCSNIYYHRGKNTIIFCKTCSTRIHCVSQSIPDEICIDFNEMKIKSLFACKNIGCNEELRGDNYDVHTKSQCLFRQCNCPFSTNTSCNWKGVFMGLAAHIATHHTDLVNQHNCELSNSTDISEQLYFIKENNNFMQTYQISQNKLIVTTDKLDTSNYGDGYIWQIYFKHPVKGYGTVICDIFTGDECKKTIDINSFASCDSFTFQVWFRKINVVPNLISSRN